MNKKYFIAKTHLAFQRYIFKHKLNSKNFNFISNTRNAEAIKENSIVYALVGWNEHLYELELINIFKDKKIKLINVNLTDNINDLPV